jgi:hypothetical protein
MKAAKNAVKRVDKVKAERCTFRISAATGGFDDSGASEFSRSSQSQWRISRLAIQDDLSMSGAAVLLFARRWPNMTQTVAKQDDGASDWMLLA